VKRKNDQSTLGSANISDEVVKAKKVKNQVRYGLLVVTLILVSI